MRAVAALAAAVLLLAASAASAEGFRILGIAEGGAVVYEEWGPAGESGYAFAAIRRADTAAGAAPPETLGMADETDRLEREIDARSRARARASRALGARPLPRPLQLATSAPPSVRARGPALPELVPAVPERVPVTPGPEQRLMLAGQPRGRSVTLAETPVPEAAPDHGCAELLGRAPTDAMLTLWQGEAPAASVGGIAEAAGFADRCPVRFALREVVGLGAGGRVAAVLEVQMPGGGTLHTVVGLGAP